MMLIVPRRPDFGEDLLGLQQPGVSPLRRNAIAAVLVEVVRRAAPQTDNNPSPAEVVNKRHLLGQPDRVEAQLVTQLHLLQGLMNHCTIVLGRGAFRKQKIAEPHEAS